MVGRMPRSRVGLAFGGKRAGATAFSPLLLRNSRNFFSREMEKEQIRYLFTAEVVL